MAEKTKTTTACGCGGCLSFIATVFALWALWFGLPTPWGTFNLDIFPPAVRRTDGGTK